MHPPGLPVLLIIGLVITSPVDSLPLAPILQGRLRRGPETRQVPKQVPLEGKGAFNLRAMWGLHRAGRG